MKICCSALCVALLALPVSAMAADDMGCDSVNWGKEVLEKFPNAQRGCRGVTMKGDKVYAHYMATVVAADPESVTVNVLDKDDKAIQEVKFVPKMEKIKIAGKETHFKDLKDGTKLDLWIQHNRWGLYSNPDSTPMTILSRRDL